MKRIGLFLVLVLLSGCATQRYYPSKGAASFQQNLKSTDNSNAEVTSGMHLSEDWGSELKIGQDLSTDLDQRQGWIYNDGAKNVRSFYRSFWFIPVGKSHVLEVDAIPTRFQGKAKGAILPMVTVFNSDQKKINGTEVGRGMKTEFSEGQYYHVAWRFDGLIPGQRHRVVVLADNRNPHQVIGKIQYAGASMVGVAAPPVVLEVKSIDQGPFILKLK